MLDVDPGLAELIPADQRAQARQATGAATHRVRRRAAGGARSTSESGPRRLRAAASSKDCCCGAPGSKAATRPSCSARATCCGPGSTTPAIHARRRVDVARGRRRRALAVLDPRWTARAAALAAARRRARGPRDGAARCGSSSRWRSRSSRKLDDPAVDALLGARRPLRQGPPGRHPPRAAAHARGAQPPGGRAPPVGLRARSRGSPRRAACAAPAATGSSRASRRSLPSHSTARHPASTGSPFWRRSRVSSSAAIRSGTGCGALRVRLGRLDLAALALLAHDRLQPLAVLVLVGGRVPVAGHRLDHLHRAA